MKYIYLLAILSLLVTLAAAGPIDLSTTPTPLPNLIKERCVHSCECRQQQDGKVDVKCQGLPSGVWPGIYPLSTVNLHLDGNPLERVDAASLRGKGLKNLEKLSLSDCRLTSIDPKAFESLMQLKSVDLSGNNITGLTAEFFKDMENFEFVNMSGNPLGECGKLRKDLSWATVHCGRLTKQPSTVTTTQPQQPLERDEGLSPDLVQPKDIPSTPVTSTQTEHIDGVIPSETEVVDETKETQKTNDQTSGSWAWWVAAAVAVIVVVAAVASVTYIRKYRSEQTILKSRDKESNPLRNEENGNTSNDNNNVN